MPEYAVALASAKLTAAAATNSPWRRLEADSDYKPSG